MEKKKTFRQFASDLERLAKKEIIRGGGITSFHMSIFQDGIFFTFFGKEPEKKVILLNEDIPGGIRFYPFWEPEDNEKMFNKAVSIIMNEREGDSEEN